MSDLTDLLRIRCPAHNLSLQQIEELAGETGCTVREIEESALAQGILPCRYQRNINTISTEDQYRLFKSSIAVIGCGGLGGYVIEELARMGVGAITAWDYDKFEEHNLNRQVLSSTGVIGQQKVQTAIQRVKDINPAIEFTAYDRKFDENSIALMGEIQVVVDALDNIQGRLLLSRVCLELGIPLVHGAIGGWYGQVTTQFPGDTTLEQIYGKADQDQGIETSLGNPAFIPAVVASLQVAEVIKILLRTGETLRHRLLYLNLLDMEIDILKLEF